MCGPGSSVGIATGYGVDGPRIESRWGAKFSASVQTGPGAHPASYTMGTRSFPGVKSGRGMRLTPHPLLVPWSWKGTAISLLPPMGRTTCTEPQWLYKGALYLTSVPVQGCTLPFLFYHTILNKSFSHTCYMPHQSNYCLYYLPNKILWEVQNKELVVLQSPILPCYLVTFRPKYLLSTPFPNILSPPSSLSMRDQVSLPYKATVKFKVLCFFCFCFNLYVFG